MIKRILLLCITAMLAVCLACCAAQPEPTTSPTTAPPPTEQLAMVVTPENMDILEAYPDLKWLDLTGSTCYAEIAEYMEKHPKVEVSYTVALGTLEIPATQTEIVLDPGVCAYEVLAENLQYLPRVEKVRLPRTDYTPQQITALQGLYPDVDWDFTLILLGQEITRQTRELNLSVLEGDRVAEAAEKLELFPELVRVDLMDSYGQCELTFEDVKVLQSGAPHITFLYSFELFGKTVSTADAWVEFRDQPIGNEGEAQLRAALEVLTQCEYFLLDSCGFDSQVLAGVRADFPEAGLVWRVSIEDMSWLTDVTTIRINNRINNGNSGPLAYCTAVKYLDLGDNPYLTDISFAANMPLLEMAIFSGTGITELSALSGCERLMFLELANCTALEDISALSGCKALANLNLSYTAAEDMSSLYALPLEKLYAVQSAIPEDTQAQLQSLLPDCWTRFDGTAPFGTGWCFEKTGYYTEIYTKVREVFGLE